MAGTISLAMIVKNGASHLRECLSNIRSLADEICLVDTGSTDETLAVAREYGAKTSVFIWCDDFAAARNESLRLCTMEWIFILDPDEWLDPERIPEIRALAKGPHDHCYWLPIRNYTNSTSVREFVLCEPGDAIARGFAGWYPARRVRLFPNGTGARFEGKVHELIGPPLGRLGFKTLCCDVPVHHYPLIGPDTRYGPSKQEVPPQISREKIRADVAGYVDLGNRLAEAQDYLQAAEAYGEALKRDPSDPETLKNLGGVLHLLGRNDEAKRKLKLALELNPGLAEAWRNLGVVYADEKEWEAAKECFQHALECDPNWKEGRRYVSVALQGMGLLEEAVEEARKVFQAMPTSGECLRLFIHQMLRLERRAEARSVIQAIIDGGIHDPNLENALGELSYYDEDFDESKEHFGRAAAMGLASAYNNLGVVHFRLQEFAQAKDAFEHCLALDPSHRGAQRNLEKILRLRVE